MYDVLVFAKMLVQDDLDLDLFWSKTALPKGMVLVDKLNGDNGFWCIMWNGFADRRVCTLADCLTDKPEW